jgi:polyphosphate kinase
VSDNIRVLSVVGRFLEHSRAYWFENDGSPELYLSSADWMERNFFRRVEIAFPVLRTEHRQRIFNDLEALLADDTNAWELRADGTYARLGASSSAPVDAQALLLERYAGVPQPTQQPQPP